MTTKNNGTKYFSETTADFKKGENTIMSEKKKTIALQKQSYNSQRATAVKFDEARANKNTPVEVLSILPEISEGYKSHTEEFDDTYHEKHARSQGKAFLRNEIKGSEELYQVCEKLNKEIAQRGLVDSDGYRKIFYITTPKVISVSQDYKDLFPKSVITQQRKLKEAEDKKSEA